MIMMSLSTVFLRFNWVFAGEDASTSATTSTSTSSTTATTTSDSKYSAIQSQGIIFAGICTTSVGADGSDSCPCRATGDCTLDDVLQVFVNVSTFILGISGSAVLFVFVYGGVKWLFSHGEGKWVDEGKRAMTAGVIGLVIIFGAYVAINFIVSGLTTPAGTTPPTGNLEDTVNQGLTGGGNTDVFTTE